MKNLNIEENCVSTKHNSRNGQKIQYLVLHYAGYKTSGESLTCAFGKTKRDVSTHYVIDKDRIFHVTEDEFSAWHCGSKKYKEDCKARNKNSIGIDLIECCDNEKDYLKSAYFLPSTIQKAKELCAFLCIKYKIDPINNIVRHYDVTGKICPAPFCADKVKREAFEGFKKDVKKLIENG